MPHTKITKPDEVTNPGLPAPSPPVGLTFEQSVELRLASLVAAQTHHEKSLAYISKEITSLPKRVVRQCMNDMFKRYHEEVQKLDRRVVKVEQELRELKELRSRRR